MRLFAVSILALTAACATADAAPSASAPVAPEAAAKAKAAIAGPNGAQGVALLTDAPKGVLLNLTLKGLSPGWHGLHFHAKGDCSAADFTSAGAHVHAGAETAVHGLLNPTATDSGDLPNLFVGPDGTATVELFSPLVSLSGAGERPALLDADGSAIIIHANPDDYMTQPIGGAGARIACGPISGS